MLKGREKAQYLPEEERGSMKGVVGSAKARRSSMIGPIGGDWIMADNGHRQE